MLGSTIGLTYNGVAKTLVLVNQDNYGGVYYLNDSANSMAFTMTVKHTVPARGKFGESHLVRLDVDHYTAGVFVGRSSTWQVLKTEESVQDALKSRYTTLALTGWTNVQANIDKVIGRES